MAKGNNGNILQHGIEAAIARLLFDKKLQVVLTHGMAPYERCETLGMYPSSHDIFDYWLGCKSNTRVTKPIVKQAYEKCNASRENYPNSGEIIVSLVGRENIQGCISEIVSETAEELERKWHGTDVKILEGSWRKHKEDLWCPENLECPWMFSMDPYTFKKNDSDFKDDGGLYPSDLIELKRFFRSYLNSKQKGAVLIFCYGIIRTRTNDCLDNLMQIMKDSISKDPGFGNEPNPPAIDFITTCHRGGNTDVATLISRDKSLIENVNSEWAKIVCA